MQVREMATGTGVLDLLMDQAAALFLHQSQTKDQLTFSREATVRAPFGAPGNLPFTDSRAPWTQWIDRAIYDRERCVPTGQEAPQPHTMCVPPGTTVYDMLDGDPASTGVCLPHAVTAASGGGRQAALARHRGDVDELKRVKAVFARLQRTGATHLAAWTASKPVTRAAEGVADLPAGAAAVAPSSVVEPAAGAAAVVPPSRVAEPAAGGAAVAPSSVAEHPPHSAAAAVAPSRVAEQPPADAAATASSAAEQPRPRSGGAPKKKGKARKRVAHVTVDTNVMD